MKRQGFTHESTYNESKEWYTPRWIFLRLGLKFDLDPASPGKDIVPWIPATNHLSWPYGLTAKWFGRVWLNPPYGQDTPFWLEKLVKSYFCGNCTGIALIFARTDTAWFHKWVIHADAICFLQGRVSFVKAENAVRYARTELALTMGCGAGSMLIAYGKEEAIALEKFRDKGFVVQAENGYRYELPPSNLSQTFRTELDFAGVPDSARKQYLCPNENPPRAG